MLLLLTAISSVAIAQAQQGKPAEPVEPPEEDESLREQQYVFNPLQAAREFQVGNFYFKKSSWRAAAGRYEEATKWNPQLAEAWLKLGEAREKLKLPEEAKKAYEKFLELAPDSKDADAVRKKVGNRKS